MTNTLRSSLSLGEPQYDVEKISADEKSEDADTDVVASQAAADSGPSRQGALQRIVTGRSATSYVDPGPPPDGGVEAWTIALMSRTRPHEIHFNILIIL
jgi:hypothetical protein